MFKVGCVLVVLVIGFCSRSEAALDIKEFLGNEPLTRRRIVEDVLEYFQQEDPHGIPVLDVPDVIELGGPFKTTQMTLGNISVSGHSQITLEHVDVNLQMLQVQVRLNIPNLEILGTYLWPSWWGGSEGDLNVTFTKLDVGTIIDLGVDDEGLLEVIKMEAIFAPERFVPNLTGLSTLHAGLVSVADTFFGSTILPLLQNTVQTKGIAAINERLKQRFKDKQFPVDISPVDFTIAKMRSDISREKNLDPIKRDDKEVNYLAFSMVLKNIELRGLSSLHRSDIIRTEFVDNRFYITIEIGTQKLQGSTDWYLSSSLFPLGSGHADLTIDSLRVSVEVQQEADVRHPPILKRIDIEIGNFALRSPGERNIDYVLEAVVNLIPNAFRRVIMDRKVEGTLKKIIQGRLNAINLEHIIQDYLDKLDERAKQV